MSTRSATIVRQEQTKWKLGEDGTWESDGKELAEVARFNMSKMVPGFRDLFTEPTDFDVYGDGGAPLREEGRDDAGNDGRGRPCRRKRRRGAVQPPPGERDGDGTLGRERIRQGILRNHGRR